MSLKRRAASKTIKATFFLGDLNALEDDNLKQKLGINCVLSVLGK